VLLIASLVLVLGAVAVILAGALLGEAAPGFAVDQLIYARVPWLLLGALAAGCALAVAALVRRPTWGKLPVVAIAVLLSGLLGLYFLRLSLLPPHAMAVAVGDPLPSYSLPDQEGRIHRTEVGAPRPPALYIFYRGHW
jgi:hypothetical protein